MVYEFRLPDVGEGIAEAEIVRWLIRPGETVALDQPIVEIQTDKAIVEVPAPVAGVIGQLGGGAGDILHVGELLVRIETAKSDRVSADPHPNALPAIEGSALKTAQSPVLVPQSSSPSAVLSPSIPGRPLATPAVRKLARELDIDLAAVSGSGSAGRITADDLQAHAGGVARAVSAPNEGADVPPSSPQLPEDDTTETSAAGDPGGRDVHAPRMAARSDSVLSPQSSVLPESLVLSPESSVREPLRGLRRRIAEAMTESWRTIPHITGHDEIDVSALVALRAQLKPAAEAAGIHLTYLPFIVKAAVVALKRYPIANAFLDQAAGEIVYRRRYNIGIATATPDGLIVPVIHDADQKSLRMLQAEIAELSEQTRNRTIGLAALRGGSFTITNFGSLGGWLGTPIIRPGEAAILGAGRIEERPWVVEGRIEVRPVMALSLSADHRLIDGDVSTGFLRTVAGCLSDPLSLFLEMA